MFPYGPLREKPIKCVRVEMHVHLTVLSNEFGY